jgi:hypothetical protein
MNTTAKVFLQINFNPTHNNTENKNDRLLLWPIETGFKARFCEKTFTYDMTFNSIKGVADYCHTFFEMITMDTSPIYCGMTLNIPGLPSTLLTTSTDKDTRDTIVKWIVTGLQNWPETTNNVK